MLPPNVFGTLLNNGFTIAGDSSGLNILPQSAIETLENHLAGQNSQLQQTKGPGGDPTVTSPGDDFPGGGATDGEFPGGGKGPH